MKSQDKENALSSQSKPKTKTKMKVCNAPPLKRSGRKRTPTQFYAVNDKLSESEAASNEKTMPSQRKAQKRSVQEPKKKVLNAPRLKTSGRKRTSQFSAVNDNLAESNSLEEEEAEAVSSTKRNKQDERRPMQQGGKLQTKSREPLMHAKANTKLKQSQEKSSRGCAASPQDQDEGEWTREELAKLQQALSRYPLHMPFYWTKVATMVGTRSAQECHDRDPALQDFRTPVKSSRKKQNKKGEAPKATDLPVISAGTRTFKRKQQVRQFQEAVPRENMNDAFSAAQRNCFEISSMSSSGDQDFIMANLEPLTPVSPHFSPVKCLYTSPGIVDSPNRNDEEKYVFQLQQLIKENRVRGRKPVPAKNSVASPSVKRTKGQFENPGRCRVQGNDSLAVWEMFPEKAAALSDSGEEEDFYFSDND
ncbi:mis18-binding protein 1-like isoform X1 [Phycodurus eques]|uniref:mis18-binding protein 1-like isoform X1 n=1 Tax=Phycodurus eques TaxID=693459 RepID=UPI002ACE0680|nr:mis18-binding protein 1-like isoform X1 [Phycodurus eques]